ncbi:unnamed protein product [Lepeophtheirus salmonis]|uniref:(salmon louse) hypothetical protein n=1 Tax=Lepeophtheirus salmonis TaxID=72036 RepID=A0A7R8CHV6_LEPSM|nr:unnamed protein product [Lepeophtheirus salmonis]CAF2826786.1 unnamed protein product [Lepeophtheirus salmonis]
MLIKRSIDLLVELLFEYRAVWDLELVMPESNLADIMTRVPKTWMLRCDSDEKELEERTCDAPFKDKFLTVVECIPSRFAIWRTLTIDMEDEVCQKIGEIFSQM